MARREAINEVRPVLEEIDKVTEVVDKGLNKAEKGVDIAAEAVEKGAHVVVEEAHQAVSWVRNPKVAAGIIIVANSVVWGFVGWRLAKRHYTKKYEAELEKEMDSARKFFGRLNKIDEDGETITPEKLAEKHRLAEEAEAAAEALKDYKDGPRQYDKIVASDAVVAETVVQTDKSEPRNVFVEGRELNPDDFDLVEEARHRSLESPYVISKDEFMENEPDYPQNSITYYSGDDVLADDRDQPVDNVEDLVGTDNLSRFGHGSGDKNIVYIRNDRVEVDFEIAYSGGKYSEEVHGFIAHSDRPLRRKMRQRDDE